MPHLAQKMVPLLNGTDFLWHKNLITANSALKTVTGLVYIWHKIITDLSKMIDE